MICLNQIQVELPAGSWAHSGMFGAMGKMNAQKADTKFPFGSLKPLWGRQVPYTVIKFVVFYQAAEFVYDQLLKKGYEKKDISSGKQLGKKGYEKKDISSGKQLGEEEQREIR